MSAAGVVAPAGWQPPSWDDVVAQHGSRIYRWAYRLTGDPHDAEDLTQDVFIRVFRSLPSYRPGSFEGWLHRITTNLFLDGVRRRTRQRTVSLDVDDAAQRLPDRGPDPAQALHDARLDPDVQHALDALPDDFRTAVLLADLVGLSYEEIAQATDVKMGTVRSRIHRGRRQMRAELEHRAPRPAMATRAPRNHDTTSVHGPGPVTGADQQGRPDPMVSVEPTTQHARGRR